MPAKRTARRTGGQDAIALLKEDHKRVQTLLSKLEKTRNGDARRNLFEQIEADLKTHTKIEEDIFYPAFRDSSGAAKKQELYYEAVEEHHVVDLVLPELRTSGLSSEVFAAKAKVLKDVVEHHIDEEENEMFPKARKAMGAARLRELGTQMEERKEQLQAGMWDRALQIVNPFARRASRGGAKKKTGSKRRAA